MIKVKRCFKKYLNIFYRGLKTPEIHRFHCSPGGLSLHSPPLTTPLISTYSNFTVSCSVLSDVYIGGGGFKFPPQNLHSPCPLLLLRGKIYKQFLPLRVDNFTQSTITK